MKLKTKWLRQRCEPDKIDPLPYCQEGDLVCWNWDNSSYGVVKKILRKNILVKTMSGEEKVVKCRRVVGIYFGKEGE